MGAFMAEIEHLCSISQEANYAKNDTAQETNEKGLKQSKLSAMILDFHLWHLKKFMQTGEFLVEMEHLCSISEEANDAENDTSK